MTNKFNPIRVCSCRVCRNGPKRSSYFRVANRKLRHQSKKNLKTLSDYESFDAIRIAGGYTD
jgi:hypothetical protein